MAYKKLDPEFKAKWLKALRSGRYRQVTDTLRGPVRDIKTDEITGRVGYCCLGVACNIISPNKWKPTKEEWAPDSSYDWGDIPCDRTTGLPFASDAACGRLAVMNDDKLPFSEIADWIEANL